MKSEFDTSRKKKGCFSVPKPVDKPAMQAMRKAFWFQPAIMIVESSTPPQELTIDGFHVESKELKIPKKKYALCPILSVLGGLAQERFIKNRHSECEMVYQVLLGDRSQAGKNVIS